MYLIGIDEAGRGPLAGPVAVGAVSIPVDFNKKRFVGVKDSKKLTLQAREWWFARMLEWQLEGNFHFHVALISADVIDKKGISHAIKRGIAECLDVLDADYTTCSIVLDGSLRAPEQFRNQKTIIKGDEKIPVISLASIAAKVTRDRYITKIAKKYPKYKLEIHKGYGTKIHRQLIKKHGPSKLHRKSFLNSLRKKSRIFRSSDLPSTRARP
ncbi:ribonuclease HII [Candidatus Parcubacteria bacterium]|nr:ribonuclease HII [Candidatus Parcubacteria bacterium]